MLQNDQLSALIGVVLAFNIAIQLTGGYAIYYFTYAIGRGDLFPRFALVSGAAEITGIFVFPWLCRILPRRSMWLVACGFPVLCSAILLVTGFVAPESAILAGAAGATLKFGGRLSNGLSTVMLADVVEYGEFKTGRRSESIIFSVQTMLVKAAGALAGFFIGVSLTLIGYVPNVEQSAQTVFGLRFLMIGAPVVLIGFSGAIYRRYYKLNDELRKRVAAAIVEGGREVSRAGRRAGANRTGGR